MKPAIYLASFITCFWLTNSIAQKKQNIYFLKDDGRYVDKKDSADYIRIVQEPDSGSILYNVMDYYQNNNVKLIGKSSTIDPIILEGTALSYYPNKRKKQIANYTKGTLSGICYDYYPNGKLYRSIEFEAHKSIGKSFLPDTKSYLTSWENIKDVSDSSGTATAVSGNGYYKVYNQNFSKILEEGSVKNGKRDSIWTGFSADGKILYKEEFAIGKFIKGFRKNLTTGDTINYTIKEALPTFKGGEAEFGKFLAQTIRYPRLAMERNIQGQMLVSFTVGLNGSLSDFTILKSVDRSLDAEAISVLKRSPKWSPAIQNGIPVKVSYIIPMSFSFLR